jgi:trimethyllysine dioxygenase
MVRVHRPDDSLSFSYLRPSRYDAIRIWNRLLTSPDAEYWVQLTPGTVIGSWPLTSAPRFAQLTTDAAIDNHRVMHGRSSFDGKRQMCGAYIGVDEYRSKLAVLREQFGGQGSGVGERSVWHPAL